MKNNKLTVFHIKAKIIFEVAEEGDRLTLYVSHWDHFFFLPWFRMELLTFTTNIHFYEEQGTFFIKRTCCKEHSLNISMQYFQTPEGNLHGENNFALQWNLAFNVGRFCTVYVITKHSFSYFYVFLRCRTLYRFTFFPLPFVQHIWITLYKMGDGKGKGSPL